MTWFGELDRLQHDTAMDMTPDEETRIAASNHQHPDHDTDVWPPENRP